jgi:tetratricopeptide (TPR) repeat protein
MGYSGFPLVDADPMKPFIPLVLLALAACAAPAPQSPDTNELAPDFGQPGEADYHLFMAEVALQRELPALAATEFLRAARATDDPEVASRAARMTNAFGTSEEALEATLRWAELAPEDLHPVRFLLRLHVAGGDADGTVVQLARLRAAAGDAERAFMPLLPLLAETRDQAAADTAVSATGTVLEDYPDDASGAYLHAYLALRAGDSALGVAEAARAVRLDPAWTDAALLYARARVADGDVEGALSWLEARPETASREVQLERAVMLMAAERNDEARLVLEALLDADPVDADALRTLAYIEFFEGRLEQSRELFMALIALDRYGNDALFYLGGIAEQQGEVEEAARFYSQVNAGEYLVTAQVRLALLLFRMGRPELAISHLELFAQRNPGAELELGSARAELLMRLGSAEEALGVYDELIARYPHNASLLYSRGLVHVGLGMVDEAVRDFGNLVALRPDDPTALNALGYTLADLTDRLDEAYSLIRRALDMAPDNAAIMDSMGWVLYRLRKPEDGLYYIQRAWELERDPEIAAHLGELLWALGRHDEARAIWLEAIVEFPGSRILLDTMDRLDP